MSDDPSREEKPFEPLLCSQCFGDPGLSFDAHNLGADEPGACRHCGSDRRTGRVPALRLGQGTETREGPSLSLAGTFFVRGTIIRQEYGAAPVVQFNEHHFGKSDIKVEPRLQKDIELLGTAAGIGVFHYGPRFGMLGEVEPLKDLQDAAKRPAVIKRILAEYPERVISTDERVVRLRKRPKDPGAPAEYDSPPPGFRGGGRLDSEDFPVLYASQDVEVCVHA